MNRNYKIRREQRQQDYILLDESIFYKEKHNSSWPIRDFVPDGIPLSIFSQLPALQAIVKYLRDYREFSFKEISELIYRAESTIRNTYINTPKIKLIIDETFILPLNFFNKKISPLENIVFYLLNQGLKNIKIAKLLNLDPRTTSTVKRRLKEKGVIR